MKGTKRLTVNALLTATALLLFLVEMQIPPLTTIPGIKIGLANVVTLFSLAYCGKKNAAMILFTRILLGSVFAGSFSAFLYSLSGGILCYAAMCIAMHFLQKPLWPVSVFGAVAHNIGQLAAAALLMQTASVFWYLPYLLLAAILSGTFTGICASLVLQRISKGKDHAA
ncbi:MAG: Gx transporter family protein [Acutalibacteraceae bacterium]